MVILKGSAEPLAARSGKLSPRKRNQPAALPHICSGAVFLLLAIAPARAATGAYQIDLAPTARIEATRLTTLGRGTADVTIDGNKLTVNGRFSGMVSAATDAHLCIGYGIGTPGTCDGGDFAVTKDTSGTLSGTIALNSKQLTALAAGQLYVQINSVGAPAPAGNLWGWILIAHEIPEQDVPQQGQGFLPQYDMPKSVEHGSTHPLLSNRNS
ncbi:MAG TPA: CHRD domain-containing protein [Rhizomicrobium sp.]|nr:CHRD domain-containing protein [Rhizomicrobium sp.]